MNIYRLSETVGNFTYTQLKKSAVDNYIDIDFVGWLVWLFTPVIITFLFPIVILLMFYLSAFIAHMYKNRQQIQLIKESLLDKKDYWEGARRTIGMMWDAHGWIYHGYEVEGLENIPDDEPALLIYYHGAIPLDYYYLMAKVYLHKKRLIRAVGDKFLFNIPGWKILMEVFHVFPGTLQTCTQVLENGELLSISPGGVREAQFGDQFYRLIWEKRIGFAKVACRAKVKIIPIFTVNLREAFRSLSIGKSWFRRLYDRTRLPIVPIYGGFPVKLRTVIGKPIEYDPDLTPEQVALNTARAIETLIRENQRIPGNILMAIVDRFYRSPLKNK